MVHVRAPDGLRCNIIHDGHLDGPWYRVGRSKIKRGRSGRVRRCCCVHLVWGNGWPRYEFSVIPYNGWDCIGPFVADVSSEVSTMISWDGKLGIVDFSNVCASFLSVSSIPSRRCSNWSRCYNSIEFLIDWSLELLTLLSWSRDTRALSLISCCLTIFWCWSIVKCAMNFSFTPCAPGRVVAAHGHPIASWDFWTAIVLGRQAFHSRLNDITCGDIDE